MPASCFRVSKVSGSRSWICSEHTLCRVASCSRTREVDEGSGEGAATWMINGRPAELQLTVIWRRHRYQRLSPFILNHSGQYAVGHTSRSCDTAAGPTVKGNVWQQRSLVTKLPVDLHQTNGRAACRPTPTGSVFKMWPSVAPPDSWTRETNEVPR